MNKFCLSKSLNKKGEKKQYAQKNKESDEDQEGIYEQYVKIQQESFSSDHEDNIVVQDNKRTLINSINDKFIDFEISQEVKYSKTLVPRKIPLDKEDLYIQNINLKETLHNLREEILRSKVKIDQLESEILEKDRKLKETAVKSYKAPVKKYMDLIDSLKQTIKTANSDLKHKDDQIANLKKNIRSSQIHELKNEITHYIEECSRLKKIIDDLKNKEIDFDSKFSYQVSLIETLQKDNKQIRETLDEHLQNTKEIQDKLLEKNFVKTNISRKKRMKIKNMIDETVMLKKKIQDFEKDSVMKDNSFKSEIAYLRRKLEESEKIVEAISAEKQRNDFYQMFYESKNGQFSIEKGIYLMIIPDLKESKAKLKDTSTQTKQKNNFQEAISKIEQAKWNSHNTDLECFKCYENKQLISLEPIKQQKDAVIQYEEPVSNIKVQSMQPSFENSEPQQPPNKEKTSPIEISLESSGDLNPFEENINKSLLLNLRQKTLPKHTVSNPQALSSGNVNLKKLKTQKVFLEHSSKETHKSSANSIKSESKLPSLDEKKVVIISQIGSPIKFGSRSSSQNSILSKSNSASEKIMAGNSPKQLNLLSLIPKEQKLKMISESLMKQETYEKPEKMNKSLTINTLSTPKRKGSQKDLTNPATSESIVKGKSTSSIEKANESNHDIIIEDNPEDPDGKNDQSKLSESDNEGIIIDENVLKSFKISSIGINSFVKSKSCQRFSQNSFGQSSFNISSKVSNSVCSNNLN